MKSKFIIKLFIFIFIPLSIKASERVRLKTQFLFPSKIMESIRNYGKHKDIKSIE